MAQIKYRRLDKSSIALYMLENKHRVENVELIKQVNNKNELDGYESIAFGILGIHNQSIVMGRSGIIKNRLVIYGSYRFKSAVRVIKADNSY